MSGLAAVGSGGSSPPGPPSSSFPFEADFDAAFWQIRIQSSGYVQLGSWSIHEGGLYPANSVSNIPTDFYDLRNSPQTLLLPTAIGRSDGWYVIVAESFPTNSTTPSSLGLRAVGGTIPTVDGKRALCYFGTGVRLSFDGAVVPLGQSPLTSLPPEKPTPRRRWWQWRLS